MSDRAIDVLAADQSPRRPGRGRLAALAAADGLDRLADELVQLLRRRGAIGRPRAMPQAGMAAVMGLSVRRLQDVTLRANERGLPVVSSCVEPLGIYLAETVAELGDYAAQLRARLIGNAHRLRCVNAMRRRLAERYPVDPVTGQRRLWA